MRDCHFSSGLRFVLERVSHVQHQAGIACLVEAAGSDFGTRLARSVDRGMHVLPGPGQLNSAGRACEAIRRKSEIHSAQPTASVWALPWCGYCTPRGWKACRTELSTKSAVAPGPEFSIKGASLSVSGLTLATRADVLSQMLSDSDRYSFTIDLTHARVHEQTLVDLKKAVLADEDILRT